jgi:hypothetical protein
LTDVLLVDPFIPIWIGGTASFALRAANSNKTDKPSEVGISFQIPIKKIKVLVSKADKTDSHHFLPY